jgi:transportin-1
MENKDYIGHQGKLEEEFEKTEDLEIENSSCTKISNSEQSKTDEDDLDSDEPILEEDIETYNKSWSLRKCSSKILEKFSVLWPSETLTYIQPYLESEIQHKDWIIRERSILVLGTVGKGTYEFLKPNLQNLITFLLGELSNNNKLIRAITCWTLSRFSDYIVSDPNDTLLKIYLIELLKRFLDPETIVQEAACSAFNLLVTQYKDKLTPYLSDVFKIITNTFDSFKGTGLLTLYDCIILLTEYYPDSFMDLDLVCELIYGLLTKWCEFILNIKQLNEKGEKPVLDVTNINFIDLSVSLVKVSYEVLFCHFEDYFGGAIMIMQLYPDDKDVICRCLDLISQLIQNLPYQFCNSQNVPTLMKIISDLFQYDKDLGIKQYAIALIGDICKTDSGKVLLEHHIDSILNILIESLTLTPVKGSNKYEVNQISVCNNSCWTLGLICKIFPEKINLYMNSIMSKIIKIFALPKLNKSLAQNAAILIGRLSVVNSKEISQYLEKIIKQFCLSIKFVNDGIEKQEAFR